MKSCNRKITEMENFGVIHATKTFRKNCVMSLEQYLNIVGNKRLWV